jgi:hypothetical protein
MTRSFGLVIAVVAGCAHGGMQPTGGDRCADSRTADPGVCLVMADARVKAHDDLGAQQYVDAAVEAVEASPACLRDHDSQGCFGTVAVLLGDEPIGLFADIHVSEVVRFLAPKEDPRGRARKMLKAMCNAEVRNVAERQRACIVLGDLDAMGNNHEGYDAACKLGKTKLDLRRLYAVNDACSLSTSPMRGASVPGMFDTIKRTTDDARARAASAKAAAEREQIRLAMMKQSAVVERDKAERDAYEADGKALIRALETANWALAYELVKKRDAKWPVGEAGATALLHVWDSFTGWAIQQATPMAAYRDIIGGLSSLPKTHPLVPELAALRDRALVDLQARARSARGLGGQWLYAALIAKVMGPDSEEARAAYSLYEKLDAQTHIVLAIDRLSPACAPLFTARTGRKVGASSTLACSIVPERKWTANEPLSIKQRVVKGDHEEEVETTVNNDVERRAYAITVHGTLTIAKKPVQIDFEDVLDDRDNTSARTFDQAHLAAINAIANATVAPLEAAVAAKAYAAAKQALTQQRQQAAENQLVIHALLAGSSSELDEVLNQFGVTFPELLPH